jgi:hypothetical protein
MRPLSLGEQESLLAACQFLLLVRPGRSPPATSCSTTSRSHADQHRAR